MACSRSPALRYSLARGAKYRRGFSLNFLSSSSIRAELAIDSLGCAARRAAGRAEDTLPRRLTSIEVTAEVSPSLDLSHRRPVVCAPGPITPHSSPAPPEQGPEPGDFDHL